MSIPVTDLDAEKAVLIAALNDRKSVSKCLSMVAPDDFFAPMHAQIFGCIAELDGTDWDPVSVPARYGASRARLRPARRLDSWWH